MTNILTAIGSSVSDDPTTAGNTGIIKPIDILCLQESDGWFTTGQSYANLLNSIYPGEITRSCIWTASTDPHKSTQSMVYNANAVSVVGQAASERSAPAASRGRHCDTRFGRSAIPRLLISTSIAIIISPVPIRPPKVGNDEAMAIRNDADTLPANSNVIYLGDFNIYTNSEAMWTTLTSAAGSGANHADTAGIDPVHQVGIWDNHAQFTPVQTQSPFNPNCNRAKYRLCRLRRRDR